MAAEGISPGPQLSFSSLSPWRRHAGAWHHHTVLPKLIESFVGQRREGRRNGGHLRHRLGHHAVSLFTTMGSLSDRFGRRPIVLLSNLGLGLDYILMALAPALSWLFVGRIISGITAASVSTAGAYIADVSPPDKRAQNFGMLGVAFGIGFILGPALGGILGSYNVHYPFWAAAAMSLLNFAYGLFVLPESLKPENRSPFSWAKANPLGSVKLLVSHHELWGLGLVTFLSQLAHTSLPSIYVLYAGYRYGWGPDQVGFLLAGVGVASMVVQGGLVQPIVNRIGERPALLLGLICASLGMTWYGTAWIGVLTWIGVPIAAFWGLFNATSQSVMSQRVSASEQGQLQGAISSVTAFAGIIGPIFFANVFARSIDPAYGFDLPGLGFWLAGALLLAAFLLALFHQTNHPENNPPADEVLQD
jgi:DHA1 family tetracycline resistance protein-like MFS transporter